MFTSTKLARAVKIAFAVGAASTIGLTGSALAQEDAAAEQVVEKIQVTGSRIKKADFSSNAPVASVGEEQFSLTGTINTESLLNTLPQVVPGLDRTSNNPGNGTASVDLRGLGTNRTLVLINGTRAVPTTAGGQVDINSIPTALIKSVEVLTGGASAIYGSDAISGVVNFILKDDFEGVQVSSGYEATEEGDASLFNFDFTVGGNFADGKGNAVINMSYTDRDELFQGDRDFSTFAQFDDGAGGLFNGGSSLVPATRVNAALFDGGAGIFNTDGTLRAFTDDDFYNYAPVNYIQLPQERHQFTGLARYEISDSAELYGRAMFTESSVPSQLAATPILQTENFTLDGNPFISPAAQQLLSDVTGLGVDTDGDGIDDQGRTQFRRRMLEVGPRISDDSFTSYQFQSGIRGDIGESNWSYDVYYQTGKVTNTSAQQGNVNRGRFAQALLLNTLDADGNETGNAVLDANGNPTCADTSSNGGLGACAPMNLYGEGNISPEAAIFVGTRVNASSTFDQKVFGASIAGDSSDYFELPGGAIGVAAGYEHRDESFDFSPSQDLAAGTIAGFNGAPPLAGGFSVAEAFVELYLPILNGAEFADVLDIELAYRSSDYSTIGSVESYKIGGTWAPIEELRFRVGFNTANRAPNIGELFSPRNQGFPGASDPCSASGSTGAGDQSEAIRALCIATGVPAANVFTSLIDPASGQVETFSGGNPNLQEEEAETLTVGFVAEPFENFTFSLDYFDIDIQNAVGAFGGGTNNILAVCYNPSDARGGVDSQYCNSISRRSDGSIAFVEGAAQNVAAVTLKGYDLIASYDIEMFGGDIGVDYLGTYLDESNFFPGPGEDPIKCAGNFGLDCGEPNPEYKHRMTFSYGTDDFTAQVLWRYVGEANDDDDTTDYAVETLDSVSYFDASGTYFITDEYRVTAGVDNLFNKKPPIIGDNQEQANTYPATYDVFGRTFFINLTATF